MYIPRILPLPPPAFNGGLDDNSGESANNAALLLWSWGVIKPPFGSASLISEIGVSSQVFGKYFFAFSFGNNQQVKKRFFLEFDLIYINNLYWRAKLGQVM